MAPKKEEKKLRVLVAFDDSLLDQLDLSEITDEDRNIYSTLILRPEHKEFSGSGAPKSEHCSQEEFARFVGLDQSRISRLLARRILTPAMPWRVWFLQFVAYTKGLAAGRRGSGYE
jgi:hypothetical protein